MIKLTHRLRNDPLAKERNRECLQSIRLGNLNLILLIIFKYGQ